MEYNQIPKTGTIGGMVDNINTNFQLTKEMLERIQLSKDNSRGLFTTAAALQTAYPSPEVGDWAIVGSTSPFDIYICSTAGTWADSGNDYNGGEVNLSEYAKKASVDSLASTVSSEASRLRTDEAWLQRVDNDNMANGRQITTLGSQLTDMKTVDDRQDSDIEGIKEDLRNLNPVIVEGNVTNNPDNVFLTSANDEITPKERTTSLSAKGHYIMRPTDNFAAKLKANYIHEIPFDVNLGGASVTIPANAVLKFTGGKIANGSLVLQNTYLDGDVKLSADVAVSGTCANLTAKQSWFAGNDVDAWHRFINGVDCQVYEYTEGVYTSTVPIDKSTDAMEIAGNNAIIKYNVSANYFYAYKIRPTTLSGAKAYLSADAAKGSRTITVTSASAFNVGNIVAIKDNSMSSFSTERNYQQGEFAEIIKKSGNVLTLAMPLFGNYLLNNRNGEAKVDGSGNSLLTVTVVYFADVAIRDLTLVSDGDDGLKYSYGFYLEQVCGRLENIRAKQWTYKIDLLRSMDVVAINCEATTTNPKTANYDDYGLMLISVQNATVMNGRFVAASHGITISTSYSGDTQIISRCISIINVMASAAEPSGGYGFDAHVGEFILLQGCRGSGIGIYANCFTIKDCNVTGNITSVTHSNLNSAVENCDATNINIASRQNTGAYEFSPDNWTPQTTPEVLNIVGNRCRNLQVTFANGVANYYPNINNVTYNIARNSFAECTIGLAAGETDYANTGMTVNMVDNTSIASGGNKSLAIYCKALSIINHTVRNADAQSAFLVKAGNVVMRNCNLYRGYIQNTSRVEYMELADNYWERETGAFLSALSNIGHLSIVRNRVVGARYGFRFTGNIENLVMADCDFPDALVLMQNYVPSVAANWLFRNNKSTSGIMNQTTAASTAYITANFEGNILGSFVSSSANNFAKVYGRNNRASLNGNTMPNYSTIESVYVDLDANALANQNENGSFVTPSGEMRLNYLPERQADVYYDIYLRSGMYSSAVVNLKCQKIQDLGTQVDVTLMFNVINGAISKFYLHAPNGYKSGACEIYYYYDSANKVIKLYVKRADTSTRIQCLISWYSLWEYDSAHEKSIDKVAFGTASAWDSSSATLVPTSVLKSGNTASRPAGMGIYVGYEYYDTTIGRPVFAKTISGDTVTWVDATGTTV
jgi:hypothetical protein